MLMEKAPARPGVCLGWVCCFLWPSAAGALVFLIWWFILNEEVLGLFALLLLCLSGCIPVLYGLAGICHWLSRFFSQRNPYGCPVCGEDIRDNPHRCRHCGTRLIWGELPSAELRIGPPMGRRNHLHFFA